MRTLTVFAGVGLVAACSVLQAPGMQFPALAALERACIEAPGDPLAWQRLGERLLAQGDVDRAVRMLKQADSLRAHALWGDYETLRTARDEARAAGAVVADGAATAAAWPADMPRTELRALGPALLELQRVEQGAAAPHAVPPVADHGAAPADAAAVAVASTRGSAARDAAGESAMTSLAARLEISNGNGVRGLAAAWGRTLRSGELSVVRLSNIRPFAEPSSRIEHSAAGATQAQRLADRIGIPAIEANTESRKGNPGLRLVLGRDLRTLK